MHEALAALLAGLAGWRAANLLVNEDGPFRVFERLRERAGADRDDGWPLVSGVLSCVWCASVWTSAGAYALGALVSWVPVAIVAAAAIAIMVEAKSR